MASAQKDIPKVISSSWVPKVMTRDLTRSIRGQKSIIDSDQNGFICKRGAALSIRLIEDILRYTEKK